MKYLFLFLIRIYWLIPKSKRTRCIFKETCSHYIYRVTKQYGFKKGILALKERKIKCKPGYYYLDQNNVRLADESIALSSSLRENIL